MASPAGFPRYAIRLPATAGKLVTPAKIVCQSMTRVTTAAPALLLRRNNRHSRSLGNHRTAFGRFAVQAHHLPWMGWLQVHLARQHIDGAVQPGVLCAPSVRWAKRAQGKRNVNALTSERLTDAGGGPTFYSCLVQVEKIGD